MYCPECGNNQTKGKFCKKCGQEFESEVKNEVVENKDNDIIQQIIKNKQQKQKRILSDKQKAHLEKLHAIRKASVAVFVQKDKIKAVKEESEENVEEVVKPKTKVVKEKPKNVVKNVVKKVVEKEDSNSEEFDNEPPQRYQPPLFRIF